MGHIWLALFILLKNALQCKIGRKRKNLLSLMGVESEHGQDLPYRP